MRATLFIISLSLLFLNGCAWFQSNEEKTAIELADQGMADFEAGSYRKAIESFERLRDWYPFSKFSSLAELKIADAHYELGEYNEAILAYEEFERLHPKNEAVPYVIFQIGNCHFKQMDTYDRDQSVAREALDTFKRLVSQHPRSEYAVKAEERIRACQKNLAQHEFYVGMYYFKNKRYKPALYRFKTVLSEYPDVGIHQEALRYIALCQNNLRDADTSNN